jgi:hypothetical protein
MSAGVAPDGLNGGTLLHSVLGFSDQARAWVKEFILKSEKGLCKGLEWPKWSRQRILKQLLNQVNRHNRQ